MQLYYKEELKINELNNSTKELFSLTKSRLEEVLSQIKNGNDYALTVSLDTTKGSYKYNSLLAKETANLNELEALIASLDQNQYINYFISFEESFFNQQSNNAAFFNIQEYFENKFDQVADYSEYRSGYGQEYSDEIEFKHYQKIDGTLYGFKGAPLYSEKSQTLPTGDWMFAKELFLDLPICDNKTINDCIDKLKKVYGEPETDEDSYLFYSNDHHDLKTDINVLMKLLPALDQVNGNNYYTSLTPEELGKEFAYLNNSDNCLSYIELCLDLKNNSYYFNIFK